jgi:hypothetical protein
MLANSDLRELLNLFKKHKIRYLVVGAYAVMKYSEPRFTKDLDLWIATDLFAAAQAGIFPLKRDGHLARYDRLEACSTKGEESL